MYLYHKYIWDKVFKNGLSEICERKPSENLKEYRSSTSYVYIPCQFNLKFPAKYASASQENAPGRSSITTSL